MTIDTPDGIRQDFSQPLFAVRSDQGMYQLLTDLRIYESSNSVYAFGEEVHYTDRKMEGVEKELYEYLQGKNHKQVEIKPIEANIEDRFMELMDHQNHN